MNFVIVIIIGYLFGSISNAYIVCKLFKKIDIRQHGSGNAGATNVLRVTGLLPGLITFCTDFAKGLAAAYIGELIAGSSGAFICSAFAVIGHNWPLFFQFKGGKGVATSLGCLFWLDPPVALIVLCIGAIIILISRIVSLSSIISSIAYVIIVLLFKRGAISVAFALVICFMIIIRHTSNIKRLLAGYESKIGIKKVNYERKNEDD